MFIERNMSLEEFEKFVKQDCVNFSLDDDNISGSSSNIEDTVAEWFDDICEEYIEDVLKDPEQRVWVYCWRSKKINSHHIAEVLSDYVFEKMSEDLHDEDDRLKMPTECINACNDFIKSVMKANNFDNLTECYACISFPLKEYINKYGIPEDLK